MLVRREAGPFAAQGGVDLLRRREAWTYLCAHPWRRLHGFRARGPAAPPSPVAFFFHPRPPPPFPPPSASCSLPLRQTVNEYQMCIKELGATNPRCLQRARDYMSVCPSSWVAQWQGHVEAGNHMTVGTDFYIGKE